MALRKWGYVCTNCVTVEVREVEGPGTVQHCTNEVRDEETGELGTCGFQLVAMQRTDLRGEISEGDRAGMLKFAQGQKNLRHRRGA